MAFVRPASPWLPGRGVHLLPDVTEVLLHPVTPLVLSLVPLRLHPDNNNYVMYARGECEIHLVYSTTFINYPLKIETSGQQS